jgi:gamma-glutamyltranspeptidase/glutathione hydrolase
VHTLLEGTKLAMADREAWYGDAEDVPLEDLLSDDYNDARRALIGETASAVLRPGRPGGREPRLSEHALKVAESAAPQAETGAGAGEPTVDRNGATRGDTCHLDVVDRWGNMIAATPSGGWLQSNPVVPGTGHGLDRRRQHFADLPACGVPKVPHGC